MIFKCEFIDIFEKTKKHILGLKLLKAISKVASLPLLEFRRALKEATEA